jgi:ABC-type multidrug transport system ATPase subunit
VIAVEQLTKQYGARTALGGVSFEVPEREIFGFVGPNGAGKTTTLRILAALLEPTAGKAYIDGADVLKQREKIHTRIGYMPDFFGVYDQLTVGEYLDFYAACYRQPKQRRQKIVDDLLALVGMTERKGQAVDTLSRGLKQRVCLARALVHDPSNIILDEPTNGLDVMSTRAVRAIIKRLKAEGRCVLFSSHVMQEVSALCDSIVVIAKGTVVAVGTPDQLREMTGYQSLEDAFVALSGLEPDEAREEAVR